MEKKAQEMLEEGLEKLAISANEKQRRQLMQYLFALHKWNNTYNLTAVRDVLEMVSKHILDSLVILPFLCAEQTKTAPTLADVGTGAGLPGIPLAILLPEWHVSLIDSNSKKTGFLKHVNLITGLNNTTIFTNRAEQIHQQHDTIVCRAFASLTEAIRLSQNLAHDETVLWAMKGKFPEQELLDLPKPYRVCASHQLAVPGIVGERHLLKITKS